MFKELTLLQTRFLTGFEKYSKMLLNLKSTIFLTSAPAFLLGLRRADQYSSKNRSKQFTPGRYCKMMHFG